MGDEVAHVVPLSLQADTDSRVELGAAVPHAGEYHIAFQRSTWDGKPTIHVTTHRKEMAPSIRSTFYTGCDTDVYCDMSLEAVKVTLDRHLRRVTPPASTDGEEVG